MRNEAKAMITRYSVALALVFLLISPGYCWKEEGRSGFVMVGDSGFEVTAPTRWVFDDESLADTGAPVFYPLGTLLGLAERTSYQ